MTCFTEIRLSASDVHAQQYGRLGFGFSRRFVIERYGGPVHYIYGGYEDRDYAATGGVFIDLWMQLENVVKLEAEGKPLQELRSTPIKDLIWNDLSSHSRSRSRFSTSSALSLLGSSWGLPGGRESLRRLSF